MLNRKPSNSISGLPAALLFNQSILDVFVLQGILELEDAQKLRSHFKTNREIETFLLRNHLVTKDTINKAYSIILKLPFVELKNIKISTETLAVVPEKIAIKLGIIPFDLDGTLLKIAVTQPADLPLGFTSTIKKLFKNKNANLELFVTGVEDFKEALKQYKNKPEKNLLMKKGSLPVVYLRNRKITRECLNKIPKSFIEKYRLLVFDENIAGHYLVACEKPDSPLTKKILRYIEKENRVSLEVFATSEGDIGYILENYDNSAPFQIEELRPTMVQAEKPEKKNLNEQYKIIDQGKTAIATISKSLFKPKTPSLTIDSIFSRGNKPSSADKNQFQNSGKEHIIKDEKKDADNLTKTISLVGKIPKEYLLKLPKEFISKYRVVVFGEDGKGDLMLATDSPASETTQKAISFIKNQHPVEVFNTKPSDIEYALNIYE